MKLTLASALAVWTSLAQSAAASDHAFQACWLLKGTTTNAQTCWYVDITQVSTCMAIDFIRKQTETIAGVALAGGPDLKSIKVFTPYTCYFHKESNCGGGSVKGNNLAVDYLQVLGGKSATNVYPGLAFQSFRCDKT